eukprot:287544-Prorocentrum_minimum.AAC.4
MCCTFCWTRLCRSCRLASHQGFRGFLKPAQVNPGSVLEDNNLQRAGDTTGDLLADLVDCTQNLVRVGLHDEAAHDNLVKDGVNFRAMEDQVQLAHALEVFVQGFHHDCNEKWANFSVSKSQSSQNPFRA